MSSTFKYHSNVDEVVPWQATYTFPSQATKVNKQTVKLVPKNGSTFSANNIVRIEFPADNYLNVLNSCLQFDVQTTITDATSGAGVVYGTATNRAANTLPNRLVFTFSATAGTIYTNSSANWADYYNGYTVAVTTSKGTFYSVVGASAYAHSGGSDAALFTFELLQPLPVDFSDDAPYKLTIIPPYLLQRGGSQNFIKRLRVIYGSIVLEDIMEYKTLVRLFFETGVDPGMAAGSGAILEGMYSSKLVDGTATSGWAEAFGSVPSNIPTETVQSLQKPVANQIAYSGALPSGALAQLQVAPAINSTTGAVNAVDTLPTFANSGRTTFCINLLSGLLTQKKLIPLKWMAAQLAIELTLAPVEECFLGSSTSTINYQWSNVNFIAEMLEFDSAYDTAFYQGLMAGGVPIKFSSFHYHSFNLSGAYNILQIHERSRSVKAAYAVARDTTTASVLFDTDRFFFALGETWSNGTIANGGEGQIQQFQWRVGGRYYPAQPIRTIFGGAEAMMELQKALDMLGDYTRQGNFSRRSWSINNGGHGGAFIMAAPFENTDIFPDTISGINVSFIYLGLIYIFRLRNNLILHCSLLVIQTQLQTLKSWMCSCTMMPWLLLEMVMLSIWYCNNRIFYLYTIMEDLYPIDVVFDSAVSNSTATQARDTPSFSLLPGIPNCVGMTVLYCQLPFSYYVTDTTNNTFKVQVGSDVYRVYLQPGTYTTTSIVQMLQAVLNIQYSSSTPELGGVEVVVNSGSALFSDLGTLVYNLTPLVIDASTKITFYVGNPTYYTTPFRLDFTESTNCGDLLGFSSVVAGGGTFSGSADTAGLYSSAQGNIYDNTDTLIGNTNFFESPYTVNLTGPAYLYLHSTLASGLPYGAVRNATAKDDIIQDVVVNNNYQGVIQYANPYPQRVQFTKTTITSASFYWTLGNRTSFSNSSLSSTSNYLSLQGQTFQVKIRFYIQLESLTTQGLTPSGNNLLRTVSQNQGSRIPFDNELPIPGPNPRMKGRQPPPPNPRMKGRSTDPASGRPRPRATSYPTSRPY